MASMMDSIASNDLYFSRIVAMIPQELYKHSEDAATEAAGINAKYFKHRRVPLAADEKKIVSTLKKKEKYGVNDEVLEDEHITEQLNSEHDKNPESYPLPENVGSSKDINANCIHPLSSEDLRERLQVRDIVTILGSNFESE
jgi:hypothetical protein